MRNRNWPTDLVPCKARMFFGAFRVYLAPSKTLYRLPDIFVWHVLLVGGDLYLWLPVSCFFMSVCVNVSLESIVFSKLVQLWTPGSTPLEVLKGRWLIWRMPRTPAHAGSGSNGSSKIETIHMVTHAVRLTHRRGWPCRKVALRGGSCQWNPIRKMYRCSHRRLRWIYIHMSEEIIVHPTVK